MWFNEQCCHFKAVKKRILNKWTKNSLVIVVVVVLDEGDYNKMAPNSVVEEVLDEEEGNKKEANWPSLNYAVVVGVVVVVVVVLWQARRQAAQAGRRSWTRSTERLTDLESGYKDDDDDGTRLVTCW